MDKQKVHFLEQGSEAGYYTDQFLIATSQLADSIFEKAVIYLVSHNKDGAMGVVINRQITDIMLSDVAQQLDITTPYMEYDEAVYFGGPVEVAKGFVLHTNDVKDVDTLENNSGICLTSSIEFLEQILNKRGAEKNLVALGYAGWEKGQLEEEIKQNSWYTVPASQEMLFDVCDSNKWEAISKAIGVDPLLFSNMAGHA